MLPLGVRVQEKLERLLDEHMQSIGNAIIPKRFWRLILTILCLG
jgi:hypothetical protein